MMSKLMIAIAMLTAGVLAQELQDRTLGGRDIVSGLTQLLTPGQDGPYPAAVPQHHQQHYSYWDAQPQQEHPDGITVQTGYEGIIAPTGPAPAEHSLGLGLGNHLSSLQKLGGVALGAGLLTHLLPFPFNKILLFLTTKVGAWIGGFLLLLVLGSAATTAVCAFTPLCTIHFFGLRFNRESVRSLLSQDRIDSATQFVYDAIAKYKSLQEKREGKSIKAKKVKAPKNSKVAKESKEAKEPTKTAESRSFKEEVQPITEASKNDASSTTIGSQ